MEKIRQLNGKSEIYKIHKYCNVVQNRKRYSKSIEAIISLNIDCYGIQHTLQVFQLQDAKLLTHMSI